MANKINGSIRKRGNTWSYRIDLGKDSTGKRIQKEKGGFKSEKEANDAMILAKAEFLSIGEIKENKHIGIINVYQRMKLLYHQETTLELWNDEGACTQIKMPIQKYISQTER